MLAVVVAYHYNENTSNTIKFENMLKSIEFENNEASIFITLDGTDYSFILSIINNFKIPIKNVIFSTTSVGNYALKFKFINENKDKFKFVKFCDFDDKSCTYKKMLKICNLYNSSDLIICKASKWSCFVNYWDKIFSMRLLTEIPLFKCFTGGDVIICWTSFYLCFKNNWTFSFTGEQIYYKVKEASRTCREKKPEEYSRLSTNSNLIKNILFYCETIESKHIYEKSENVLDIDFRALQKTINLNDFITHMALHYKY